MDGRYLPHGINTPAVGLRIQDLASRQAGSCRCGSGILSSYGLLMIDSYASLAASA